MAKQPDQQAQAKGTGTDPGIFVQLSKEDFLELIREARRDPKQEAKDAAEDRRMQVRRQQMIHLARQDERAKRLRQQQCRHTKPNGEKCVGGQAFSDGRTRLFCLRCQKVLHDFWSPEVAQGMIIAAKLKELGLTEEELERQMREKGVMPIDEATNLPGNTGGMTDDFVLGMPRGNFMPDLTTDTAGRTSGDVSDLLSSQADE